MLGAFRSYESESSLAKFRCEGVVLMELSVIGRIGHRDCHSSIGTDNGCMGKLCQLCRLGGGETLLVFRRDSVGGFASRR